MKNVVTIGGGGGHAQILKGLRRLEGVRITGICPGTDSGGSTGVLMHDYGSPGYVGDLTRCVAALCPDEKLAAALVRRFKGGCLHGHSLKNVLLAGLVGTEGITPHEALGITHRMCGILPHCVVPASMEETELCATLKFGGKIAEETHIDRLAENPLWSADTHAITSVFLRPAVRASREAQDAIRRADTIIVCPGDLYSSIIPALLPRGITHAFRRSKARVIVMLNIMTKQGETDDYCAEDFVREIEKRMGVRAAVILHNSAPIPRAAMLRYRAERKVELATKTLRRDPRLMRWPLLRVTPEGYLYHDPAAVAEALGKILAL